MPHSSLSSFHPVVVKWFTRTFADLTPPQALGWPLIAAGENLLMLAPTGSGKTLAAFLKCLDWLYQEAEAGRTIDDGVKVLYISPLKALNNDIHRNLELPLQGIDCLNQELGAGLPMLATGVRSGDTPAAERRRMLKKPPQILITTPESLFLLLSSQASRILATVRFLILDEIHALFPTKRGVHLALSLERLEELVHRAMGDGYRPIQRIGLSATVQPLAETAAYLAGFDSSREPVRPRPVRIIDTGQRKRLDLQIDLPVPDLTDLPDRSIWPSIYEQLLKLIGEHRTTLIFVNNRRLAERITANLNQMAGKVLAMTHHGSVSKELRLQAEQMLQDGAIPCIVATSTLELGIDIGHIDLVIQIESPKEVGRGLQRVGRAGHVLGLASKGRIVPKTRADLLEAIVLLREMRAGRVESSKAPLNCLDILAQQIVAMATVRDRTAGELYQLIRGAYNYTTLSQADFENVLAMLAGMFQTEEFVELRPRVYWDRITGRISADSYGRYLVYSSGGTIPDRGYYGVYLSGSGAYLGELDEEFVYERRLNERFMLGTSAWRIEEIRRDRVIVTPAKSGEAMIPFWKAEQNGRPYELGCRIGAFLAIAAERLDRPGFRAWLERECGVDQPVATNLEGFLKGQQHSLGFLQTDRRLVVEEFPDEVGEWKVLLHSPYGLKVNTILGMLIRSDWETRHQMLVQSVPSDDGVIFHCPGGQSPPVIVWADLPLERLEEKVGEAVSETALFGVIFRHAAQRALILPRGAYGRKRNPLWLSRLKAGNLLNTVSRHPDFPLIIETYREILQDYFDLGGVRELLDGIRRGGITVERVRHDTPSPLAYGHLFNLVNNYMYENDAPKAERRAELFGLGRAALRSIVGERGFRDLFTNDAIRIVIEAVQGLDSLRAAPTLDRIQYWLEKTGDIRPDEITATFGEQDPLGLEVAEGLDRLCRSGRALRLLLGRSRRELFIPAVDRELYDVVWGAPEQPGPESQFPRDEAARQLIRRYARSHGPFTVAQLIERYGFGAEEIRAELAAMAVEGFIESGRFLPEGREEEWCDRSILKAIHRRCLSVARREAEPKQFRHLAALLAEWQGMGGERSGAGTLLEVLYPLIWLWLPAGLWEQAVLPARVGHYQSGWLDQAIASGQYVWRARTNAGLMEIRFEPVLPEEDSLLIPTRYQPDPLEPLPLQTSLVISEAGRKIIELLRSRGALSLPAILQALSAEAGISSSLTVWQAIEELMLAGMVTNDSLGPVRYLLGAGPATERLGAKGVLKPAVIAQMGRWALLPPLLVEDPRAQAIGLLRRYGLVCREMAQAEGAAWGSLYPVYDLLESAGKIRRGYFIEGLSGIQYALPEAVERLREIRNSVAWTVAWDDPANPGRFFPDFLTDHPWLNSRPQILTFDSGTPLIAANSERKIRLFTAPDLTPSQLQNGLTSLTRLLSRGRDKITIVAINGTPITEWERLPHLISLGYEKGYKELTLWPSRQQS